MTTTEIKNMFGNDVAGIIFEYASGMNYDDTYKASEYIKSESRLFLMENENLDWEESDINEVCHRGWVEVVKRRDFVLTTESLINCIKSNNQELIDHALRTVKPEKNSLTGCIAYKLDLFEKMWDMTDKSDSKRKRCVNEFVKKGHLNLFKKFYVEPSDINFISIKVACIERRENILNFIVNDKPILEYIVNENMDFISYLIQSSYYDLVIKLLNSQPTLITIKCVNEACVSGNEEILRLCLKKKPGYIDLIYYGSDMACSKGYMNIVKVLCEYGYEFSEDSINGAIEYGHLDIAKFLYKNYNLEPFEFAIDETTVKGHLNVLEWLYATRLMNVIDINYVLVQACCSNHLPIVKWLCTKIKPTQTCMDCACERNSLDVAKFLYEKYGLMCTDTSFDVTASEGHIEMIHWLTSIGNTATMDAVDSCACTNQFDMLIWLDKNRTEKGTQLAIENAVKRGNIDMVNYLLQNNYQPCSSDLLLDAMKTYSNSNICECVFIVCQKYPTLFSSNMLEYCNSYFILRKMVNLRDQADLPYKLLYKIVLNGVRNGRLKIINMFINRIVDNLESEDKLELLNSSEQPYIKKYLEMRFSLSEKIDFLFDVNIPYLNKEIHNLFQLNCFWNGSINNHSEVVNHSKEIFLKIIDGVNEENINKYGSICYLVSLQYRSNWTCTKPVQFGSELFKILESMEVKPEEHIIRNFNHKEYESLLKNVMKKMN